MPSKTSSKPKVSTETALSKNDVEAIDDLRLAYSEIKSELGKIIIGQEQAIERMFLCMLSQGHALLMGVPGLAKTLLVNSISQTTSFLSVEFNSLRSYAFRRNGHGNSPKQKRWRRKGIRLHQRTDFRKRHFGGRDQSDSTENSVRPPRSDAGKRVTVAGTNHQLQEPFFVLATQNPIEQEGTYPLPEAQLDRFMFLIRMDYPSRDEEISIARQTTAGTLPKLKKIISGKKLKDFQQLVERVPVPDHVHELAVDLVRRTRPNSEESPAWLKKWVQWGAGPRAVQYLIKGAKARPFWKAIT